MIELATLAGAFTLGLMGGAHCVGMCGGIGAALGFAGPQRHWALLIAYNLGRIAVYSALGALAGGATALLGEALAAALPTLGLWLRTLTGLLVIAMGLYVSGWWLGLARIEAVGGRLWRHVRPLAQTLLPPRRPHTALALGAVWGLLPCGLVYSSLAWAALGAHPLRGALLMAAFGAGTLPAMLLTAAGGKTLKALLRRAAVRRTAGALLIVSGAAGIALPWWHAQATNHHHADSAATVSPRYLNCH